MPSYKVILNDEAKTELRITSDDVETRGSHYEDEEGDQTSDNYAWFNFYKRGSGDDEDVTIAAIPYKNVLYINS